MDKCPGVAGNGPGALRHVFRCLCWAAALLCLLGSIRGESPVAGEPAPIPWKGADGSTVTFESVSALEEYLRTANVVSMVELGKGTTRPQKALLDKDGVQIHAVFRTLDYYKRKWGSKQGVKMDFKDKYIFEIASYELGKLLGLDNIPPVVLRKIDGKDGSLQAWVEETMNEDDRLKQKIEPPDARRWLYQFQILRLFDNLIYNEDRNQGNILIDKDWKVWMIDATRAFQSTPFLKDTSKLSFCERPLWEALQALNEEDLKKRLEEPGYLTPREVRTVLTRRDLLVEFFQKLIEEKGESMVIVPGFVLAPSPPGS